MTVLKSEEEARAFVAARCATDQFARLERFLKLLAEEAKQQNLIARGTLDTMWLRHVADSAQLLDHVPRETGPWLDLGSGAGFPGLVLALMQPQRQFVLIESRNLRIRWLNKTIDSLDAGNCRVIGMDAGKAGGFEAGVISARAFAPLARLIAISARFSTASTHWVLPKGRSASQEVEVLPETVRSMFHVKQSVTEVHAGIVVGVGKVEASS